MTEVDREYHTFSAFTKSFDWSYMDDKMRLEHGMKTINKLYGLHELDSKQKRSTINRLMRTQHERKSDN